MAVKKMCTIQYDELKEKKKNLAMLWHGHYTLTFIYLFIFKILFSSFLHFISASAWHCVLWIFLALTINCL